MQAPGTNEPRYTLLFDGDCPFCQAASKRLAQLSRPGSLRLESFRAPGVLARFPQITAAECEQAMQLVDGRGGRVYAGPLAAFRALATRPVFLPLLWLYHVPGVRWCFDRVYAAIARRRFQIMRASGECGDACRVVR